MSTRNYRQPSPATHRRAASPVSQTPEHVLRVLQRSAGNAATSRMLQRLIYKDDKAKEEGGNYQNIERCRGIRA
ncbi:hypothetical protein [Ornithinicoccus hortensis]|uniref:hypothetical protein n=1 Tax=Ornithinicoccus hortensis TaxID=82346 RepID=UPI0011530B99|nr:hypothetical protein [Ornithinicoccus hortensis]